MILNSRSEAREYAENHGWKISSRPLEMIAFDPAEEVFWHLVKRGGFLFDPYFSWEKELI